MVHVCMYECMYVCMNVCIMMCIGDNTVRLYGPKVGVMNKLVHMG